MINLLITFGRALHDLATRLLPRWRALFARVFFGLNITKIGVHTKFRGFKYCSFGSNVRVGDFCWIEAVEEYGGQFYTPALSIGNDVAISDLTHISCVERIIIGDGCLLGSKIYIGDHSHGPTRNMSSIDLAVYPARRQLSNTRPIHIGHACWIGDGAVILGGTRLAAGSIVAANSVVRIVCDRPALVAGVPASIIRFLD